MSTGAGKRYLGDAVETRYRLPRLWKRVIAGEVPVWKARQIATRTIVLSEDAAGFVDQHVAPTAHRCSYAQIDRAVDHARDLYDPEEAEAKRAEAAEHRQVAMRLGDVTIDGQVYIEATTDLADALAFEAAARSDCPRPPRGVPGPVPRRTPVDGPRTTRQPTPVAAGSW